MNLTVIGGGIIGLACALELARAGHAVAVLDAAPGAREASWAAGGMLAPHHEAFNHGDLTDSGLWRLGCAALARWPDFAAHLGGAAAIDLHLDGGLVPLQQGEDPAVLAAAAQRLRGLGVGIEDLSANQLAARAPALAVTAGGWWLPGGRVDPRRCLVALHAACLAAGVTLRYGVAATRIEPGAVIAADGAALAADEVVIASGAWSPALAALTGCALHGEPVKGQMVRFAVPDGLLPGFVHARQAYLIPRSGAGIVVGATMVSSGFDKAEDADAIALLTAGARRLLPRLAGVPVAESWTGLRPRLDGGLPLIARLRPGLVVATGHFRNGILLAPETAAQVTDLV